MNKLVENADAAIEDIQSGMTLMLGGFGLCGIPENCIAALVRKNINQLTCISNNAGVDDFGLGFLLQTRQIKKMISSYVGENAEFERQVLAGELEIELVPQGTLAERIRRPAWVFLLFHRHGLRHGSGHGKEVRDFEGRMYIMERALIADFAIVKAWKGDAVNGQPHLPRHRPQLQSDDGQWPPHYHCRSGRTRPRWRTRAKPNPHARHLCAAHFSRREL